MTEAADADRIGGKATGLIRLAAAGVRVPWWIVVSTEAFARHIAGIDPGRPAAQVRTRILSTPVDDELAATLTDRLADRGPFAVRSSVVGEDSDSHSFAGAFDTYLYLGVDDVVDAVRRCWASAFNDRAVAYRRNTAACTAPPAMAVIVQEMVEGDVSGVLFTRNPLSGKDEEILVSAGWGLGEGIVSGQVDTDQYISSHAGLELSVTIADKATRVVRCAGVRRTHEAPVPPDQRSVRCLSHDQLRALTSAALRVARHLDAPQDIEWTVRDNDVVLLQTRPITASATTDPVGEWRIVWDNSNIQESFNGITSPLSFSYAVAVYETVHRHTLRMIGVPEATLEEYRPVLRNMIGLVSGRVYYNINNWYLVLKLLPSFDRNKEDLEHIMGVEHPVDFVTDVSLSRGEKLRRLPNMVRVGARLGWQIHRRPALVVKFQTEIPQLISQLRAELAAAQSLQDVLALAERGLRVFDLWTVPTLNDFYMGTQSGRARRIVAKVAGDDDAEHIVAGLLGADEAVESLEPTRHLMALAKHIQSDSDLTDALTVGAPATAVAALRERSAYVAASLDDYLTRYGDRLAGEQKLETVSLQDDPSFLAIALRNFVADDHLSPIDLQDRHRDRRAEFERDVMDRLTARDRRKLRGVLRRVRSAVEARENMRFTRTRLVGAMRAIYTDAGRRMAAAGVLDDPRQIFYLTMDELHAYAEARSVTGDLAALVRQRYKEFTAYAAEEPPNQFETYGPPGTGRRVSPECAPATATTAVLRGIGCSPGIAEGELCVIRDPNDDVDVKGKIITAIRTDPGWGPLFPSAAAILVERGSTVSHSAILARELGVPAVVGIPGLIDAVRNGEWVRLDGRTGIVERLEVRQ
jgi:phosphoenolpyruvate synthase/pyruvate phosphate dikinase